MTYKHQAAIILIMVMRLDSNNSYSFREFAKQCITVVESFSLDLLIETYEIKKEKIKRRIANFGREKLIC